jgi:hypothetical protein
LSGSWNITQRGDIRRSTGIRWLEGSNELTT